MRGEFLRSFLEVEDTVAKQLLDVNSGWKG